MRRTRIVYTLGPATDAPGVLAHLARVGMNVARLNFSHGTHEEHERRLAQVRALSERMTRPLAALQDLCGPKLRTGPLPDAPIYLAPGHRIILTTHPEAAGRDRVYVSYEPLFSYLKPGERILLGDGLPQLRVEQVRDGEAETVVTAAGTLGSRQGLSVPDTDLPIAAFTDKDRRDLHWGIAHQVDWIAASFVRSAQDLEPLRAELAAARADIPLVAKIEKREAIENLDQIIAAADGIMVARGDLGVEMPLDQVPMLQKQIIRKCNRAGKPVITATQMLESMIANPRPTRAEVSDIANAILDGTDALMLSGETAIGKYPRQAASTMARVATRAEQMLSFGAGRGAEAGALSVTDAISEACVRIAGELGAKAIISSTTSGFTARMVSKYRPRTPILAVTPHQHTYRRLALVWGVCPLLVAPFANTDEMLHQAIAAARQSGWVRDGDTVVVTAGLPVGVPGHTNLIRVGVVGESIS